jgi:predicted phage-related endonuclease
MMAAIVATPIVSTDHWHALRKPNVGCSEVGALFGVHEYLTGYALAARKLGRLPPVEDNPAMKRGRLLEGVAKQLVAELKPEWWLTDPRAYYCDNEIHFGATPDLFVQDGDRRGVVQIKTCTEQVFAQKWRKDDRAIEPPLWIAIQAMCEQHLTGSDFAYVAVLVIGNGLTLELIEIPYLPAVIEQARERVAAFWLMIELGQLPAPDYGRDSEVISQLFRQDDGAELDLSDDNELPELVETMEAARRVRLTAQDEEDQVRAQIVHKIGMAAKVKFAGGTITAKTVHRAGYEVKPTSFRPVRVKMERRA